MNATTKHLLAGCAGILLGALIVLTVAYLAA
jgi:hypothetical protein